MSKEHKKLYKAGKNWLTATITVAALMLAGGMATQSVKADTTDDNANTQLIQNQQPATSQDDSTASQAADTQSTQQNETTTTNQEVTSQEASTSDLTVSQAKANAGNQWTHFNQGWSYTDGQGNWVYNQWQRINNNWYYFNNGGYAQTGWFKSGAGNWYHFDDQNAWANTGWQRINNRWYYFDNQNAWALTGWQKINNRWYFFDPTNAWADTGWFKSGAGNWYYFDPTNAWADTGWFYQEINWYYFDPTDAWALTGWQKINNRWYYFDPTNVWAASGWDKINNKWYYFDIDNCWMLTGIVDVDGSNICIFKDNGEWTGDYYSSVADAKTALVDIAQRQVDNAQVQVDEDQNALNKAKDNLDVIENGNHLAAPQEWIDAWKSILRKEKNVFFLSNKDQTIASEYQTLLRTNQDGRDMNFGSWEDNPIDEKIPVTFNADSTLSDHDATIATQYAAYLLNQLRAQLGTPLYQITKGSVAISQETAKLYLKDNWSIWNKHSHDIKELNTVLPEEWGVTGVGESIYGGDETVKSLNDLKHLVFKSVVYLIFEGDHSDAQFGHATDLLGIRLNSDLNWFVQSEVLGVSIDSKNGFEIHFNSIDNPNGSRVNQQVQTGYQPIEADPSSKINQEPYRDAVEIPDYKANPADIPPYKQAIETAQNKLKESQSALAAAKDHLKQVKANLNM
jgi:SEC10/PgrA surface exclusion-like protein